ncbi:hypothetical protein ACMA1D_10680 [Streptomyces sp. 796.1]|uniref:hypothetical protein n=1 Tax=Streptomyces sp. 796.1 TaxID=3163029 RepID=UPI0039C8F56C
MAATVRIVAGEDFTRVANALRAIDARMPTQLRKEMRDAVKPFVRQAQQKVRTLPVAGNAGHTGLRRKVARGVRATAAVGGRRGSYMRIVTSMPEENQVMIPRGLDGERGWRHPVFGNRNEWVTQRPIQPGWFVETLSEAREPMTTALLGVLQRARDTVAAARS